MNLTKKVREACWQATHDITELRDALESAVSSYRSQSETAEERTSFLEYFTKDMDEAVTTMQNVHGLVLINPNAGSDSTWYKPWTKLADLYRALEFSSVVSKISVEKLGYISRLAQYAMQGLEKGVHEFADKVASVHIQDESGVIAGVKMQGANYMEYAINGGSMLPSLARVCSTKNMVDEVAEPVMKYTKEGK